MRCSLVLTLFSPDPHQQTLGVYLQASDASLPAIPLDDQSGLDSACQTLLNQVPIRQIGPLLDAGTLEHDQELWLVRSALVLPNDEGLEPSTGPNYLLKALADPQTVEATETMPGKANPLAVQRAIALGRRCLSKALPRQPVCAVVGCKATSRHYSDEVRTRAEEAGRLAAERGFVVLTGGLGGVMADAARGARAVGGHTVGILPGERHEDGNPHLQVVLPSGLGYARNYLIALGCDVMIALPGGRGTLEEMCFALDFERLVLSWGSYSIDEAIPVALDDTETLVKQLDAWYTRRLLEHLAYANDQGSPKTDSPEPCLATTPTKA